MNKETDDLLTFKEAQEFLRCSRSTLYRLMWTGQLAGHKVGNTWRFYRSALRKAIRQTEAIPWPCKQEEVQA